MGAVDVTQVANQVYSQKFFLSGLSFDKILYETSKPVKSVAVEMFELKVNEKVGYGDISYLDGCKMVEDITNAVNEFYDIHRSGGVILQETLSKVASLFRIVSF